MYNDEYPSHYMLLVDIICNGQEMLGIRTDIVCPDMKHTTYKRLIQLNQINSCLRHGPGVIRTCHVPRGEGVSGRLKSGAT